MISKQLLSKLKDFNLNTYESKIWVALLMKGQSTAGSLSEVANVPRSRCYDVLESLEKKGFIIMKVGKPITYIAVEPKEAIERVKNKLQSDVEEQINLIEEVKKTDVLSELNKLHKKGSSSHNEEETNSILRSEKNIHNHLKKILKESSEVYISADSADLKNKALLLRNTLKDMKNKPSVKVLSDKDFKEDTIAEEINKIGELKYTDRAGRFIISDNNALLFLDEYSQNKEDKALLINSQHSIDNLKDLFTHKWNNH